MLRWFEKDGRKNGRVSSAAAFVWCETGKSISSLLCWGHLGNGEMDRRLEFKGLKDLSGGETK